MFNVILFYPEGLLQTVRHHERIALMFVTRLLTTPSLAHLYNPVGNETSGRLQCTP